MPGPRPDPLPPPVPPEPLIGRDREYAHLRRLLGRGKDPSLRILALHGEHGIGKTSLAARLALDVGGSEGLPVCWLPLDQEAGGPEAILLRMLAQLGLEGWHWDDAPHPPDALGFELLHRHARGHLSASPAVVVLDEVAWRFASRRLLPAFIGTACTVIVTTSVPVPKHLPPPAWITHHLVRPLDASAARRLVRQDASGLPDDVLRGTVARGNPAQLTHLDALLRQGPFPENGHPHRLLDALLHKRLTQEIKLLNDLVALRVPYFSTRAALALGPQALAGRSTSVPLTKLVQWGLVQREGEDRYSIHPVIRTQVIQRDVARRMDPDVRLPADKVAEAALGDLDARLAIRRDSPLSAPDAPQAFPLPVERIEEYLSLCLRRPLSGPLASMLADWLAERGDVVRLLALRGGGSTWEAPGVDVALGRAARASGALHLAARQFTDARELRELAVTQHHLGDLKAAEDQLSALTPRTPRRQLDLGAVLTDQGRYGVAAQALAEAEREFSTQRDERGRALTLLARIPLALLVGAAESADALTESVYPLLRRQGDGAGLAWLTTYAGWRQRLGGTPAQAADTLGRAVTEHRDADNPRGEAWSGYHRALALADTGSAMDAGRQLNQARKLFAHLPDELGTAWTEHKYSLVVPQQGGPHHPAPALRRAANKFATIGCPRGEAWSRLDLALLALNNPHHDATADTDVTDELVAANSLFTLIGDLNGLAWVAYAHAAKEPGVTPWEAASAVNRLAPQMPPVLGDRIRRWADDQSARSWFAVPLWARDVIAPLSGTATAAPPLTATTQVRLTLLDGSPIRVRLRVVPAPDHPWATAPAAELPWLTALATPLSAAEIHPALSLFKPSNRAETDASGVPESGTDFEITPRLDGLHRFRFTISDERTGAVLQQVETELDIPGTDTSDPLAGLTPARRGGD
ncbi:AAA family ATPase [Streptomyces sp. NPDC050504]|uniref:AAA family ATPase n=1 Tax=Streptomyces sp. NPDC050504 TaxID=3365618 RepID=UPI003791707B